MPLNKPKKAPLKSAPKSAFKSAPKAKANNTYYQFKTPLKAHPKVKVLKKGDNIIGIFLKKYTNEVTGKDGATYEFDSYAVKTGPGEIAYIKGCGSLARELTPENQGVSVSITYLGQGKAAAGKKPPFLFDINSVEPLNFDEVVEDATDDSDDQESAETEDFTEEVQF